MTAPTLGPTKTVLLRRTGQATLVAGPTGLLQSDRAIMGNPLYHWDVWRKTVRLVDRPLSRRSTKWMSSGWTISRVLRFAGR